MFNLECVRWCCFFPGVLKIFVIMIYTGITEGFVAVDSQEIFLVLIIIGRKRCVHRMGLQESGVGR